MAWIDHARATLSDSGHRAGGAREAVLELLSGQHCCLSAQEIHDRLRASGRSVGLASVYRALDTLAELKLLHRVDVGGTAAFEPADPTGEHHHHVICQDCGQIGEFEDPALEQAIDEVASRLGYRVDAHELVLRGSCPDCA